MQLYASIRDSVAQEDVRHTCKIIIAAAAMALLFGYFVLERRQIKRGRMLLAIPLAVVAAASVLAYFEFGWIRFGRYMNLHDFFHYYLGSKYSRETGYFNLYGSALAADRELGGAYSSPQIRDLRTHGFIAAKRVSADAQEYKSRFSPERWEEFKKDVRFFQRAMLVYKWNQVLRDKGYNATPVWNMVARWLAERAPTDDPWRMAFLAYIDPILLAIMFGAVWAAFGWRVLLFAIAFFGVNFMMSFVHIKGAFLRMDWVACLVIGVCLVKMGWYKTAGALMSYGALARVFPIVFVFGIAAKLVLNALKWLKSSLGQRKMEFGRFFVENRRYFAFLATFLATSLILVAISVAVDGGFAYWREFFQKISVHNRDISTTRVGFKYIFLWPLQGTQQKQQAFEYHRTAWIAIQGMMLLVCVVLVRKLEDYEAVAFSFVPGFFLVSPTFYYYVMLIVPLFLFIPKLGQLDRVLGAMTMFGISITSFVLYKPGGLGARLSFEISCMLLGLVVYMMAAALWAPRAAAQQAGGESEGTVPPLEPAPKRRKRMARVAVWACVVAALCGLSVYVGRVAGQRWRTGGELALPAVQSKSGDIELVFVGDVMFARNVADSVRNKGRDYSFLFQKTSPLISGADVAFCNLESPISGRGSAIEKKYLFRSASETVNALAKAGFDAVSLANNHILDYGLEALNDTVASLNGAQIRPIGLCEKGSPQTPQVFEVRGVKVGYLGYADRETTYAYPKEFLQFDTRPAEANMDVIKSDLERLKSKVDVIVISLHWGTEYSEEPSQRQKELGRFLVDNGADVVAGHHPHVQQEPEIYNGGLIIYSLGNFVFDQWSRPLTRESRLYRVFVNEKGFVRADYLPVELNKGEWQPTPTAREFVPVKSSS